MADKRVGGILELKVDGNQLQVKGNWTYNLGRDKKEAVIGADGVHGYKQLPQAPFLDGIITDSSGLDLAALRDTVDATAILRLANGKIISIEEAFEASDGDVTTEEGEVQLRFEGTRATEIAAG